MMKNNFPRVLFISLANPRFSMGVNTLSSVLKNHDCDVSTIYFAPRIKRFQTFESFTQQDFDALTEKCAELAPDMIGISVYSNFLQYAIRITKEIKRKLKKCLIVWGGIHPTLNPEESLAFADVVCRGEGEQAIVDLLFCLQEGKDIKNIDNVYLRRDHEILKNSVRLINDLDSIPWPDSSTDRKYILKNGTIHPLQKMPNFYSLMTSRGCFFTCSYCSNQALKDVYENYRVRRRSENNVLEELRAAVENNPNLDRMFFYDDIFTFDLTWMRSFATRYKEEIGLPFFCYTHPQFVNDEMIKTVKDAGCNLISMGIQGCSTKVRKIFNRQASDEEIVKACRIINKYRFDEFYLDIIFSPFENLEDRLEGLKLLVNLPKPFYVSMHSLSFFPKANITDHALQEGLISEKDIVSNMLNPPHQLGNYLKLVFTSEGKWWYLYSMCGKRFVPNGLLRLCKIISGAPFALFSTFKILERIPLMLNKRNVFTR